MSDIDKNIEILEEFKENGFASLMIKYNKNRIQTNTMVKMAIENMLSEFEGLREFSAETVRRNAELQVELEIYKKIAERLAKRIDKLDEENYNYCQSGETHCKETNRCIQCIIDWARKEVEK